MKDLPGELMLDKPLAELKELASENENKLYFVFQTEVYYDEIRHVVISIWDGEEIALKEAEKQIKIIVGKDYKRIGDSFYGGVDDTVYITSVCAESIGSKDDILEKNEPVL